MKKLLEKQNEYIEALKNHTDKTVNLLNAAKNAMGNYIGSCKVKGCTHEKRCHYCTAWVKVWDDIDTYLKDNE